MLVFNDALDPMDLGQPYAPILHLDYGQDRKVKDLDIIEDENVKSFRRRLLEAIKDGWSLVPGGFSTSYDSVGNTMYYVQQIQKWE